MALHLYDTRTRLVRPFSPLHEGQVGIYLCGPTVQSPPHVGHLRTAVAFDVLRRWLLTSGYDVTLVRNVTDIDDKIIINAAGRGETLWALAERNTRLFNAAYDAVGVLPPTVEPRATGHVPEMVALMQTLLDKGHAYEAGGSVWFSVGSYDGYGGLSGQRPDAMQPSPDVSPDAGGEHGKRDPRDFALWKAARPGEPTWPTPWGDGRPGWHLECSAMAGKYLGDEFDLHGGGLDLVFPHHENERAQTVCGAGVAEMARWWVHAGLLTVAGGEKMSKSLGNVFDAAEALAAVRPQVLRFYLGSSHYRSTLEYGPDALAEAAAAYERLEAFALLDVPADAREPAGVWEAFTAAMDDDLAVPRALAVVFGAVSAGHKATGTEQAGLVLVVRRMLAALGLDPVTQWPPAGAELRPVLDAVVEVALAARAEARARKDFAASDAIRERLAAAGVVVEDTAGGQRWRLAH